MEMMFNLGLTSIFLGYAQVWWTKQNEAKMSTSTMSKDVKGEDYLYLKYRQYHQTMTDSVWNIIVQVFLNTM